MKNKTVIFSCLQSESCDRLLFLYGKQVVLIQREIILNQFWRGGLGMVMVSII